jgi:predicted phage tail protein
MQPQIVDLNAMLPAEMHRELSDEELRQQLADALAARKAADEKVSTAKQNLKRADDLLGDAEGRIFRLEGEFKKAEQLVAACVADAIRAGSPLPMLGAPEIGQAELSAAKAEAASIRAAREVLATEHRAAAAEATKAAAAAEKLSRGANRLKTAGASFLWTLAWTLGAILLLFSLFVSLATL